jgi:hypothetical protein
VASLLRPGRPASADVRATSGAPSWARESEAPPEAGDADELRKLTRLAWLKALVARFEARQLGHRVAMHLARCDRDDDVDEGGPARGPPRWPDSFFEP